MVVSIFFPIFAADFKSDRTMIVFGIIAGLILLAIVAVIALGYEEKVVEKAQENNNKAAFWHLLAKMTASSYKGYNPLESEKKALDEFVSQPSEYDTHPIGSYLKMRKELSGILKTAGNFHGYRLSFNLGEVGTGVAVMLVFAVVVTLGVMFA